MFVLRKDVWVGNPSHSGLQSTKFPVDVVCDEVKNKVCSKDKSRRIILRVFRAMCAWRNGFDKCNWLLSGNRKAYTESCFVQMCVSFFCTHFVRNTLPSVTCLVDQV